MFAYQTAYSATEAEISTFDQWTASKRPALPGRMDREMVDVIAVVEFGLRVLNDGDEISLGKLLKEDDWDRVSGFGSVSIELISL